MNKKLSVGVLMPLAVWAVILALPMSKGLPAVGWYYFAMFMAVIVGLVLEGCVAFAMSDNPGHAYCDRTQKSVSDFVQKLLRKHHAR